MDLKPRSLKKINDLLERGVSIPNPETIDIGDDVAIDRISGKGVKIYPGCRIYGKETTISSGCQLGYEAPVTIENCQLAEKVELKGGFFSKSVFLEKSNMGMGAHVREGCILEEEAGGAHCVGLKQTILFPFVTLGSLINFCDCLMGGGTSRSNHSEVGSSYIHFNFTPDADKTTPSLLGDVPRGVMLNQPPIFLGGQGGIIGPVRLGFGNVVAAGSVLRHDYPGDNQLIFEKAPACSVKPFYPAAYPHLERIVENNILYLANLKALEAWYTHVRKPFLETGEYGSFLYAGVMEQLSSARKERLKRLKAMAQKAAAAAEEEKNPERTCARGRKELHEKMGHIEDLCNGKASPASGKTDELRDTFLNDLESIAGKNKTNYIETIQALPAGISSKGVMWLDGIVRDLGENVSRAVPKLGLLKTF
ncbi:MAG TPA: UDP-N-acetylglucosamine pyrophosphorylase [Smithella sp.]|jgi:UDP-N-acetylglucosamine/UDP-N-acetylgalactosamine diphosphorylase|nr:UDP-N-acetylglucosamine pyrophosphorylase [Smithella sp.]OQC54376.1 MAG: Bifunctional protein GlmU [Deltaproteobacteria bacterium ADurb.Bin022]HNQ64947.1 UDP-N-acetylglucosamine pyrophosphorylase [Smithella sp.]HOE31675.1 UDP-N-acetylglucosamine pyrophosphorylase [Smithella sp.]HOO35470.1 UDP-N-acetylglucosamine pyrophosphorylase [Smithella sp.]